MDDNDFERQEDKEINDKIKSLGLGYPLTTVRNNFSLKEKSLKLDGTPVRSTRVKSFVPTSVKSSRIKKHSKRKGLT